jgi:hypothetical protein
VVWQRVHGYGDTALLGKGNAPIILRYDRAVNDWSDEQTDDPLYADLHNFYKVEAWSRDGMHIDALLYAGNNLDKAREIFVTTVKHRPRIRLTIRQRARVLQQWPPP